MSTSLSNRKIGGLSRSQSAYKRGLDMVVSLAGLLLLWWLVLIAWLLATIDTRRNGFFTQQRVGLYGRNFRVVKIRTMRTDSSITTTVTSSQDPRITRLGKILRKSKIDELPQLWNVLIGDMSLIGPRPDVAGFADRLQGEERIVLSVRPGITGPATLKYRNEEELLATTDNPEKYNREVIFPDKVKINMEYIRNWSLKRDIRYLLQTIVS